MDCVPLVQASGLAIVGSLAICAAREDTQPRSVGIFLRVANQLQPSALPRTYCLRGDICF
jgi:hypothetical protein